MKNSNLISLGLNERFIQEASMYEEDWYIGRVSVQHRDIYNVTTEKGEIFAEVSGKFKYSTIALGEFPAVGDWVLMDRDTNTNGNAIIHRVLSRKSSFQRKVAGQRSDEQIVAANIDTVFICMALNNDFNLRRLERYISVAWDSRATPVVILTKSDLCNNIEEKLVEIQSVTIGMEIVVTSSLLESGFDKVREYVAEGRSVAFIGSSGVGKSTMINKLLGTEDIKTTEVGNNDKGRHTTTYRQLFKVPDGGVLIDTPGMRELGIISGDIEKSFSDIDDLAKECKFSDCRHENEPKCAVRKAIEDGVIDIERLNSYRKLQRELIYSGLKANELEKEKIKSMFGSKSAFKQATRHIKNKTKNKY